MPTHMRTPVRVLTVLLLAAALAGCRGRGDQLTAMQADVTHSAAQLVESDALARQDWIRLQGDLESQRVEIGRQRDLLEADRRRIAWQRRTESALYHVSLLIVCCLPLVVCWLLLRPRSTDDGAEVICDLLIDDLAASRPQLLSAPRSTHSP